MTTLTTEALAERLTQALQGGALSLMLSLGHRTGLFDALASLDWASSAEVARAAGLSDRYVREWLGAMVVADIVSYDEEKAHYKLPAEAAALLTRSASANMAATMQWVPVLGAVEDEVVAAFRHGRGVPYSSYRRFHEVMAEESAQTTLGGLDEHILPVVPGLEERLCAGLDALDVGCGAGGAVMHLAARFPRSRFTGIDLSSEAIDGARQEARCRGLGNANFVVQDAATLPEAGAYDLVTAFDAIHDQRRPAAVLSNIARALRPGGVFLMQDIDASSHVHLNKGHPLGTFLYTISCMHCMSVALTGGGAGLGAVWGRELARQMLREAGFERVEDHELPHDQLNRYYVARR